MLIKAINCERLKCKGTLVWPAFLLVPIIPAIMGAGNYLNNLKLSTVRFSGDSKILIRADTPF